MVVVDRYHAAGLHRNPFAAEITDPEWIFVERGLPAPPPAGSATLVQVIGDKGAGKTTQVQAWRRRTPGPYHYIPRHPYRSRWAAPPIDALVYADEIDRMPRPLRSWWMRRLGRSGATLVAGTHRDLSRLARRCGFEVVTHHLGPASLELMSRVIERRLAQSAIAGKRHTIVLTASELRRLHERAGGSLRRAETLAHELVAERVSRPGLGPSAPSSPAPAQ